MITEMRVMAGEFWKTINLEYVGGRIICRFNYNKVLIEEIKSMEGAKYHGFDDVNPQKHWSIKDTDRNAFQFELLQGGNPFAKYEVPLVDYTSQRDLYEHQLAMVRHGLTFHYVIFACEMGTGKTLAAIEIMESIPDLQDHEAWYVGPKSGVMAVSRELRKWDSKVKPEMMTYEGLVKKVKNWEAGEPAPRIVIFDESSKLKTPTAQRSKAAQHVANAIRAEHGDEGFAILMSGTPAPKTPVDWWSQCEVACPGFLKEGNVGRFKNRLCIIENRTSLTGGAYPHIITWLDDSAKCAICGDPAEAESHTVIHDEEFGDIGHRFEESVNEIEYLYKRMDGLVLVQFKDKCLDLPDKQYQIIDVDTTVNILRAAKLIKAKSTRAIQALTELRELSDGFQYEDIPEGKKKCEHCHGRGVYDGPIPLEEIDPMAPNVERVGDFTEGELICTACEGSGEVDILKRITKEIGTPKDKVFIDLLDQAECGRFIVWGGFTGTIDRLVRLAHQQGWSTLRVDGRGYEGRSATDEVLNSDTLLDAMDASSKERQALLDKFSRVCFVGHPQAGGMALTLTASPVELFYSNSFNGEARMQAEDRFHRAGMDTNRGATIIDLIHLPSDRLVLDNLKQKKRLQDISMGELETYGKEDSIN